MRIKNAFRMLLSNVSILYKTVLFRFICTAVVVLIGYFAVLFELEPIFYAEETAELRQAIGKLLTAFLSGAGIKGIDIRPAFDAFMQMLDREQSSITSVVIETGSLLFFLRFCFSYGDYVFANVLNDFMSTMNNSGFFGAFFARPLQAAWYAFLSTLIFSAAESLSFALAFAFAVYTLPHISIFAIIIAVAILVFMLALTNTLMNSFLPSIVSGKLGVLKSLGQSSPKGKAFGSLLGGYVFLLLLFFYINMSFGLFTLYIGLIISLPFTSLCFIGVRLIEYYRTNGLSYYVDYETVVRPKEERENADLLKYL